MRNKSLAADYVTRARHRCAAVEVLLKNKAHADTVRESQEIVELALKGLLRFANIEVPRIHDVSDILIENTKRLPKSLHAHVEKLADISRTLRRDRELAFYGSEDLTPSEFYKKKDADKAYQSAVWVVNVVTQAMAI